MASIAITHRKSDGVTLISIDGVTLTRVMRYEVSQPGVLQQPEISIHYHDDTLTEHWVTHKIDSLLMRTF